MKWVIELRNFALVLACLFGTGLILKVMAAIVGLLFGVQAQQDFYIP